MYISLRINFVDPVKLRFENRKAAKSKKQMLVHHSQD